MSIAFIEYDLYVDSLINKNGELLHLLVYVVDPMQSWHKLAIFLINWN